jgi:hypothetical protein
MSRYCSCHRPIAKEVKFDVNADPETYIPQMETSPHLEFVRTDTTVFEDRIDHLMEVINDYGLDSDMPDSVLFWLEGQKRKEIGRVEKLCEREHEVNAYLLAERVVHKFMKWGPVRFGLTPACQNDFYDGSHAIDSLDNPVRFEPVFRTQVLKLARKYKLNGDQILRNLHIGANSAKRFAEFIDVEVPDEVPDNEVDLTINIDDCNCFLCVGESGSEESRSESEESESESEDEKIEQSSPKVDQMTSLAVPRMASPQTSLD